MIETSHIQHANCPKQPEGQEHWPFMLWGGFSMVGVADYVCEACGMTVYVNEDYKRTIIAELEKIVVTTGHGEHDEMRCAVCGASYNDWTKFLHKPDCKWVGATRGRVYCG